MLGAAAWLAMHGKTKEPPARACHATGPMPPRAVPEAQASHGHQLRLWEGLGPSGGLMHQLSLSARGRPSAQPIDQLRLWARAEPIGSAFMIRRADGPGAAHRGRLFDQHSLSQGRSPIRIPYQIRDADGWAPIDQFCLCYEMLRNVTKCYEMLSINIKKK